MTDNLQAVKALILEDAAYWDAQMNEVKLRAWSDQLKTFPANSVKAAMLRFRGEKGRTRMPMPADIISHFSSDVGPDAEATAAAARIFDAIGRYGWPNGKEAQIYIGSLGWAVVKRMGGWLRVCEMVGVDYDKAAFLAHAKSIAKAEAEYARAGRHNEAPVLPEPPPRGGGLQSFGEIIKLLPEKPEGV